MHPDSAAAAKMVIARGLNVRQTEALANKTTEPKPKPEPDAEREALEHELAHAIGLRVKIDFDGQGGTIRIAYRSLDQLDALIAKLSKT